MRFNNDNKKFNVLLKNLSKYQRNGGKGSIILQKKKRRQQIVDERNDIQHKKEEEEDRQQRIANKNAWVPHPQLPDEVFDNVDMDGNVSYTMGPYKYNLEWYDFQKKCDQDQSYKYPPFATDYEKNWKPRKEGYLIRKRKRDDELSKKYGTKVIRTTD